jgi:nucleoside-diphosphate kinase
MGKTQEKGAKMKTARTAVLVKPDGLQRGLIGEIINRFEKKGLKLIGLKMVNMTDEV